MILILGNLAAAILNAVAWYYSGSWITIFFTGFSTAATFIAAVYWYDSGDAGQ